jgi:hypothetical protein
MFSDEIDLIITCEDKKFEGLLSDENINDFGIFYNYVRKNIIENKSLLIK